MSFVSATFRTVFTGATFFAGALAVAACQQDLAQANAPLASGAYGLHYVDMGDAAKLAYGKANSDTVSLMLECAKGSRAVEISDVARGDNRKLSLRSAGMRSDFGAEVSEGPGAPVLLAMAGTDTPALKAFRETGKVEVTNGALRYDVNATRAEQANVERFFNACERAA